MPVTQQREPHFGSEVKELLTMPAEYLVIHREDNSEGWKTIEGESNDSETFVRENMTPKQVVEHEWVIFKVDESHHRDEYKDAGRFDDLAEQYENSME